MIIIEAKEIIIITNEDHSSMTILDGTCIQFVQKEINSDGELTVKHLKMISIFEKYEKEYKNKEAEKFLENLKRDYLENEGAIIFISTGDET